MDGTRFDGMTRALAGAITRRGALGAIAGLVAGGTARDTVAKRKRCRPTCPGGQTCRRGECACDDGGAVCGANCCRTGQSCEGGRCVDPAPRCLALAERCGGNDRPCCDGLTCASGQGGKGDVACYAPAGGACETSADCVWFAACEGGVCIDHQPVACTVCARGCRFTTIEAAIAAADPGDVVTIAAGAYAPAMTTETVEGKTIGIGLRIARPLTLAACAPGGTVTISCPAAPDAYGTVCIGVLNAEATFEGLSLVGPGSGAASVTGFVVDGAGPQPASATIRDSTVRAFGQGLLARNGATVLIEGGFTIADSGLGLALGLGGVAMVCAEPVKFRDVDNTCFGNPPFDAYPDCGC